MNNKKIHTQLIVLDNEEINSSHFRLHLNLPADCPHIQPGQFAEFYVPPTLQSFYVYHFLFTLSQIRKFNF